MSFRTYYPKARCNIAIVPRGESREEVMNLQAIQPKSVKVNHNPVNEADKFTATFSREVFPLDPRRIESASVDVHMGNTDGLNSELPVENEENRVLLSSVDRSDIMIPGDGASEIVFEGRNYASFLLDSDWPLNYKVELDRPMGPIIESVIAQLSSAKRMFVSVEGFSGGSTPIVESKKSGSNSWAPRGGTNVWSAISELGRRVGAIVTVREHFVVVRPPRTVETSVKAPLFVSSRNLSELTISKQLKKRDIPNVLVRAVDPRTRETVKGQYPDPFRGTLTISKTGGGAPDKEKDISIKKFNVNVANPTKKKLNDLAEKIWRRYEAQQLKVEFSTQDMDTWEIRDEEPTEEKLDHKDRTFDLTQLRNGDSIRLHIDRDARTVLERATSPEKAIRLLERKGFDPRVAEELAEGWNLIDQPFFVSRATHDYDDGSYSLQVEAKNATRA